MIETLYFSESIKNNILKGARWAKFLAILGFIGTGFMVLAAQAMYGAMSFIGSDISRFDQMRPMGSFFKFMPLLYLVMAAVYFFLCFYLFQYAAKSTNAVINDDQSEMELAFTNQFKMYRLVGITTIVTIVLYALIVIRMMTFASQMAGTNINSI